MIARSVITCAVLVGIALAPGPTVGQEDEVPEELAAVREGLAKAYNTGDLDLLLSFCHDDVIAIWQHGEVARGPQGVRDVVSQLTSTDNRLIAEYSAKPTVNHRVFLGDGDIVVSSGKLNDSYTLTNLRTGFENSNWSITAFVSNATDEDYLEEVIPAPEFGGSFIHPGAQRRAGLEVTYSF